MKRRETQPVYTPSATYRLQLNKSFTFEDATGLVNYLDEMGITDIYASPFLMARPGSMPWIRRYGSIALQSRNRR